MSCDCGTRRQYKHLKRILTRMENTMVTKDEFNAKLDEMAHDQARVINDLRTTVEALRVAVENGNLDAAAVKLDEMDAQLEAASPEPTEPPVEPGS